ncbi:MAG: GNAT family N-acetyltransferase [Acidimicrobiia bacterium]|nr:GNAT family N-acetyltransferase [Acidimicrobiia bacterium]
MGSVAAAVAYPLPDPPLADDVVRLRPWTGSDAPALAAAWADDEIRRWTAVPERPDEDHARRWIAGERIRRERGLGFDLVISPAAEGDATVLGEVGIATMAGGPDRAEAGWWVGPDHRRRGVATRAVGLVAVWCRDELGLELFAEVDPDNLPSVWVAESAGCRLRLKR